MSNNAKFYYLTSSQRTSGNNNRFNVELSNNSYLDGILWVESVTIPYSFFQITSSNNKLVITDSDGEQIITISSGTYTGASLASALQTALNAASALTYTVTFDASTLTFTFSVSSGTIDAWDPAPSTMKAVLGLDDDVGWDSATEQTSANSADLSPIKEVFVSSNQLSAKRYDSTSLYFGKGNELSNNLCRVALSGSFGDLITFNNLNKQGSMKIKGIISQVLDFYCTNKDGSEIDFRGVPWSIVLGYIGK